MRKFWRSRKSGGSCARLPRSRGVLRAVSPGVGRNGFTPRFRRARDCCGTPAVHGFREHGGPFPKWKIPALRPAARTGEGARRWWYSSRVNSIRTPSGAGGGVPGRSHPRTPWRFPLGSSSGWTFLCSMPTAESQSLTEFSTAHVTWSGRGRRASGSTAPVMLYTGAVLGPCREDRLHPLVDGVHRWQRGCGPSGTGRTVGWLDHPGPVPGDGPGLLARRALPGPFSAPRCGHVLRGVPALVRPFRSPDLSGRTPGTHAGAAALSPTVVSGPARWDREPGRPLGVSGLPPSAPTACSPPGPAALLPAVSPLCPQRPVEPF